MDKCCRVLSCTSWIAEIDERENSGISTLKIDYNRKDGYYFHVTNSQLEMLFTFPQGNAEKRTLRYRISSIEGDMLEAREKSANLEYEPLCIREEVSKYIQRLQVF